MTKIQNDYAGELLIDNERGKEMDGKEEHLYRRWKIREKKREK